METNESLLLEDLVNDNYDFDKKGVLEILKEFSGGFEINPETIKKIIDKYDFSVGELSTIGDYMQKGYENCMKLKNKENARLYSIAQYKIVDRAIWLKKNKKYLYG